MPQSTEPFVIDPYVLAAAEQGAKVVWVSAEGTTAGEVVVEPIEGGESHRIEAEADAPGFQRTDGPPLEHLRQIATVDGLEPYTAYRYRVEMADGEAVRTGEFKTAAPAGHDAFRFTVISDTHNAHDDIARAMGSEATDFVIHTGDLTSGRGHGWDYWLTYFESARPYLESAVLWPMPGGHDIKKSTASNYRLLFGLDELDGDPSILDDKATWYSFRFGTAEFFSIDSNEIEPLDTQLDWLDESLAASEATWKVVTLHDSQLVVGSSGRVLPGEWVDFARIVEKHNVDLVIGGDCHIYERSLPIGTDGIAPTPYVCIHAASNHRTVRPSPVTAGGFGKQSHNYAALTVDGNRLSMDVTEADGTVIDELTLVKDADGRYQQEVMEQALDIDLARELGHIYTGQDLSHDLRYSRRDLKGEFSDFPVDDGVVTVSLDVHRFPEGSQLIFFEQDDPHEWRVEGQEIEVTGDRIAVEVTAPEDLGTSSKTFTPTIEGGPNITDPHPEFEVTVRVDGREFEPVTIRPSFGVRLD